MKLSPQHERLVEWLRDLKWHCSTEIEYIRDARKRLSELNRGYMLEKGYRIIGTKCDKRCGKNHSSGLFMRKAIPLTKSPITIAPKVFQRLEHYSNA